MSKKIVYGDEARNALVKGINAVADAVKVTLGPKGKNVVIEKEYGAPQIINDGISIAKEVELDDPVENMGAKLIIEATTKANDEAGDGSTSTVILTQAMIKEGMKSLTAGRNAVEMKRGMQQAAKRIAEILTEKANPVESSTEIAQVGSLSAGNDEEVGELIATAMDKVGKDGVITVGESSTFETTMEVTEGMQFDRGYVSPHFVTDPEKGEVVFDNPYILCANKKLGSIQEIMNIIQGVAKDGSPLLIIAEDVEGEALATLVINNMRKIIRVAAVKAPDYGANRKDKLEDIAVLTGGKCAVAELGVKLEDFTLADLGRAEKVIITKDHTTIVVKEVTPELENYVKLLNAKIKVTENEYEKDKLKERLAKLVGGVAVIKVGALNEVELKERKLRIEDALNATRAAVKEGIVAGGGTALLEAQIKLLNEEPLPEGDLGVGYKIVLDSLSTPVKQIAENAGLSGDVIVSEIKRKGVCGWGYDALKDEYGDMIEKGIIDPVKVTKNALLNAASMASMVLTAEASIARKVEEPKENLQGLM